ncbi:MAG: hypothetical protein ACK4RK_00085 [Gemmataceae bacterium]
MSSQTPPRTSTAIQLTRQQIDELEALMQRMLALPVAEVDEAAPPEAETEAALPAAPPVLDPTVLETAPLPEALVPPPPGPTRSPPAAPPPAASPAVPEETTAPVAAASSSVARNTDGGAGATADLMGPPSPAPLPALPSLEEIEKRWLAEEPPPIAPWLTPLVWINRSFDLCTYPLGGVGRWLRGQQGRNVLGWTGGLLLVAAVAWALWERLRWNW